MRFAIPTYKRYKALGEKTLKTLDKFGIDKDVIDIFVNNQEEYEIYKPLYPDYNVIVGELGIKEIREFIVNYYKEGDKIVCMDDDIEGIKELIDNKTPLKDIDDLEKTILKGFELCEENNTILWGVYPCDNKGFMKHNHSTHLAFCGGWLYGMIVDKDVFKLSVSQYDDYERSIKVFKKYNKVIRLNNICAKTRYNKNEGGMCDDNRINIMKRDLELLMLYYGEYLILKKKKNDVFGYNPQIKSNIR